MPAAGLACAERWVGRVSVSGRRRAALSSVSEKRYFRHAIRVGRIERESGSSIIEVGNVGEGKPTEL